MTRKTRVPDARSTIPTVAVGDDVQISVVMHTLTYDISTDGSTEGDLLFAGVSYGNLKIRDLSFSRKGNSVVIYISVCYNDNVLWSNEFSVNPINGI